MQTPDRDAEVLGLLARGALEVAGKRLEGLTLDTRLADTGIDSVGIFEMVGFVEDALGLRLPDHEIPRLVTVRDVAELIARTRAEAAEAAR